jgi:hypothetical protein
MPSSNFLQSTIRSLSHPANRVLQNLLGNLPATEMTLEGWRERLIAAGDSLLVAEAPEARLVPSAARQGLLREVLASMVPKRQTNATPEPVVADAEFATMSLPREADLR